MKILVIDDEPLVRETITDMLESAGHEVDTAVDGAEGMARQIASPADLVITDMIMPGQDGVATTAQLRSRFPRLRILAVSGGGRIRNMNFLDHARAMGADGALEKPFSRDQLLNAIEETLGGQGGR